MSTERETNNHESHQTLATGTQQQERNTKQCKTLHCREKASCPLNGKRLAKCVIYKATVTETTTKNQESYIGLIDNEFKTKCNQQNHHLNKCIGRKIRSSVSTFGKKKTGISNTPSNWKSFKKSDHIHQKKACANFVWKKNIKF